MKSISVVIPIHICSDETRQLTRDAIHSIIGQYNEIILINDGSPQNIGEFRDDFDMVISLPERCGYIHAANEGIRRASFNHICMVCNDTRLICGDLQDLCTEGYAFPKVEGKAVPFWDGSFYCFDRKVGGLYDERFENYFGDLDKFYDAKQKGVMLELKPNVVVWHKGSATSEAIGIRNKGYEADRLLFKDKWGFDPVANLDSYYKLI